MLKQELASGVIQYIFPKSGEKYNFGNTIIAVVHENKAILIDSAYKDEAPQVFEDLVANGIAVDSIILSHSHNDHTDGFNVLPEVPWYGSSFFNLEEYDENQVKRYIPIENPTIIEFGKHTLEIIPSPGHSECTVLVKINGQFIHVADEIMYSHDGQPLLPWIDSRDDIKRQLESWNKIKDYHKLTIIPAHGPILDGNKLHKDIQNRAAYAEAILMADGKPITYEEATKNCDCTFLSSHWFKHLAEK
ncbi:MAG: MBL fold metallo-hydrolase [Defluviitaleaceae bacterium]|nr:MBL fold metallo-hydrolase [Defluviitaleaceae bacterium]